MRHILGTIFMYGGFAASVISGFLAFWKAMNDDDEDKEDVVWGLYIFHYPVYTVIIFGGLVLSAFGYLWRI